jgi:hypothetical protein
MAAPLEGRDADRTAVRRLFAQSRLSAPNNSKALSSESAPCRALSTSILMSASVMGARPPSMTKGCEYTGVKSAVCRVACWTVAGAEAWTGAATKTGAGGAMASVRKAGAGACATG